MVRDMAKKLGDRWAPRMEEVHKIALEKSVFSPEFWKDFSDTGLSGALIPEKYGGSDMGLTALTIALDTMAAAGAGSAIMMLTQMDALCILRAGPERAREKYLPAIAAGNLKLAFAITEPDAGSNSFRMSTVAARRGDDYVLRGQKTFITGVDVVDKVLVVARSVPYEELKARGWPKTAGFNVVIVDPKAEGFSMTEIPTAGIEGLKQWTLHFDRDRR